jgi:hypothetical protein
LSGQVRGKSGAETDQSERSQEIRKKIPHRELNEFKLNAFFSGLDVVMHVLQNDKE